MKVNLTHEQYKEVCDMYTSLTGFTIDTNLEDNFSLAYYTWLDVQAVKAERDRLYWENLDDLCNTSSWNFRV